MAKAKVPPGGRGVLALASVVTLLSVTGCQLNGSVSPSPTPSGPPPRPFTVMSTDPVRVTDPAAITDSASAVVSLNVFQRLMTADPGQSVLKPDAARDCIFTSATTYSCTLNEGLTFHNGHALTASDVKFSIQRATRLNVAGSSTSSLSSLRRIETPDPQTVRFVLSRPDTQFGWALASPAASIVDEEIYQQDDIRPPTESIVGSGPFAVAHHDDRSLLLTRHGAYVGRNPAAMQALEYRTVADSATIEDAMANGKVDVVWRGLNAAAITRYGRQVQSSSERLTADGFAEHSYFGERVLQLGWNPASRMRGNRPLRQAIATALQGDRTLDSIVPPGIPGHTSSFPLGGKATPKITWKNRIPLTLTYDSTAPDALDIATQIRTRLENPGGSVSSCARTHLSPTSGCSTARRGPRPALRGCSPTSTRLCRPPRRRSKPSSPNSGKPPTTRLLPGSSARCRSRRPWTTCCCPSARAMSTCTPEPESRISEAGFGPGWQLGSSGCSNGCQRVRPASGADRLRQGSGSRSLTRRVDTTRRAQRWWTIPYRQGLGRSR